MKDRVAAAHRGGHGLHVFQISADDFQPRIVEHASEVGLLPGAEIIEDDEAAQRGLAKQTAREMAADKARAAGNEDILKFVAVHGG